MSKIIPFLWFNGEAEQAMNFYVSLFKNSRVIGISRYGEGMPFPAGTVMTASFELDGQLFTALNGGPAFKFNEAISFQIFCDTQEEVNDYWQKLSAGGDETAQQCGWLKDKYGVTWQIVPTILSKLIQDRNREKANRVVKAMLQMHKLDIKVLKQAYQGE